MNVAVFADLGVEWHGQKQATRSVGLLLILLQPRERAEGAQGLVGGGSDLRLAPRRTIGRDRWGGAATHLSSGPAAKVAARLSLGGSQVTISQQQRAAKGFVQCAGPGQAAAVAASLE